MSYQGRRGRGREPGRPRGGPPGGRRRQEEGGRGRGGGGGGGGRQDEMVSRQDAQNYMQGALLDVYSARPEEFLLERTLDPDELRSEQSLKAIRPNAVNEVKPIWQPLDIELNLFLLDSSVKLAYQYDLQVNRQVHGQPLESREVYQKVFKQLQKDQNWPESVLHDGRKTIWDLSNELPQLSDYEVVIDNGKRSVFVTFKLVRSLENMGDLQQQALMDRFAVGDFEWIIPQECIRVLEVALHHSVLYDPENYILRSRTVFDTNQDGEEMTTDRAYEVLCGYQEAVRVVSEGLVMNINTVYNMAKKHGDVTKFYRESGVQNPQETVTDRRILDQLNFALGRVKVTFRLTDMHGNQEYRTHRVQYVDDRGADDYQIHMDDGALITVSEYYERTYGYKIKYPKLNLLDCTKVEGHPIMVPPELCRVQRGEFERAQGRMQAELIRKAAKQPSLRHQDINRACDSVVNRIKETPASFWINQLRVNWIRGKGHLIPPPIIQYQGDCYVKPKEGVWQGWKYEGNKQQFHKYISSNPLESMGILNFDRPNSEAVQGFLQDMVEFGNQHTMESIVPVNPDVIIECGRPDDASRDKVMRKIEDAVDSAIELYGKHPQIIFVLLPREHPVYKIIKSVLEGNHFSTQNMPKLVSQHVVLEKFLKGRYNFGYMKQIMLKINQKLRGSNFRIAGGYQSMPIGPTLQPQLRQDNLFNEFYPCMFFGADVTHPSPGDSQKSSIAAIVGSLDSSCTRYAARISKQEGKQEYIDNMEQDVHSLLEQFQSYEQNNNQLPQTIVMYRDGVSSGQYDQVLAVEYSAMRRAANRFGENYYPKITFVIVAKRHHVRPRPAEQAAGDRNGNLRAGIVIDKSGCHPYEFQFYLNSHATIQGTNRPALYTVLVDEVGFGAEQLQLWTNWLTYTYQRCTRSVSIPPPAYLAHLACTRGRILEGEHCDNGMVHASMLDEMYWV